MFEWGYRRGNDPQHFREEYLSQKAHNFKAKLRWGDAYEVSTFDLYNTLKANRRALFEAKVPRYVVKLGF